MGSHPAQVPYPENLRSTFAGDLAMKLRTRRRSKTSIARRYELEEVLFCIHPGVRFPLRVRLPLVCNPNARRASRSTDALATGGRPKELFRMARPRSVRNGFLFHPAMCSL